MIYSLQAVNEFLISQNVFGQIWIQKYFGGQIGIEMYSLHSDVHFSNLMMLQICAAVKSKIHFAT